MRRALLVLGMHRSGTSAVAGLMVRLGVESPRTLMPPNEFNPLGYWESEPIVDFHDRLLRGVGTSWDAWTKVQDSGTAPFEGELSRIVATEFGSAPIFVVKDPRMCRVVPLWLRALQASAILPGIILVMRDPIEVARSLAARDRIPPAFALLMWLRHMLDAEYATRALPRTIVRYDAMIDDWRQQAHRLATALDISWPCSPDAAGDSVTGFLKPDLRHHVASRAEFEAPPPLDRWTIDTLDALERLRRGEESPIRDAGAALDAVRGQLDEAERLFGRADETRRFELAQRVAHVEASRHDVQARVSALEAHAGSIQAELQRAHERTADAGRRIVELEANVGRAHQELATAQHDAMTLRSERDTLQSRCDTLQHTNGALIADLAATRHEISALRTSRSWRVTAPLRAVFRVMQKFTGGS